MKFDEVFETEGYKILFPWTEPQFDEESQINYITAENPITVFEIRWKKGGKYVCYAGGHMFGACDSLKLAISYCIGLFRGEVMKGFAYMLSLGVDTGEWHDRGEWSLHSLRAFAFDQAREDILAPENISKLLAFVKEADYTENMEDDDTQEEVDQTKPTLH